MDASPSTARPSSRSFGEVAGRKGVSRAGGSRMGSRNGWGGFGGGGSGSDGAEGNSDESGGESGSGQRPRSVADLSTRLSGKVAEQSKEIRELRARLRAAEDAAACKTSHGGGNVSLKEHRELMKQLGMVSKENKELQMQVEEEQRTARRLQADLERAEMMLSQARGQAAAAERALGEARNEARKSSAIAKEAKMDAEAAALVVSMGPSGPGKAEVEAGRAAIKNMERRLRATEEREGDARSEVASLRDALLKERGAMEEMRKHHAALVKATSRSSLGEDALAESVARLEGEKMALIDHVSMLKAQLQQAHMEASGSGAVAREMQVRASIGRKDAEEAAAYLRSQEKEVGLLLSRISRQTEENHNLHTRMVDAVQAAERAGQESALLREALKESKETGERLFAQRKEALETVQLCKRSIEAGEKAKQNLMEEIASKEREIEDLRLMVDAVKADADEAYNAVKRDAAEALNAVREARRDAELEKGEKEEALGALDVERGKREGALRGLGEAKEAMIGMSRKLQDLEGMLQDAEAQNKVRV